MLLEKVTLRLGGERYAAVNATHIVSHRRKTAGLGDQWVILVFQEIVPGVGS